MRTVPLERLWVKNVAGNSSITSSGVQTYNLSGLICGLTTKPKLPHYSNHLWAKFGSTLLHTLHWHVCVCVRKHYDFHSTHISLPNKFNTSSSILLKILWFLYKLEATSCVCTLFLWKNTLFLYTVCLFVRLCHWERLKRVGRREKDCTCQSLRILWILWLLQWQCCNGKKCM